MKRNAEAESIVRNRAVQNAVAGSMDPNRAVQNETAGSMEHNRVEQNIAGKLRNMENSARRKPNHQRAAIRRRRRPVSIRAPNRGSTRQDYSEYRMSAREWVITLLIYLLLDVCISFLFFNTWLAFFLLMPGIVIFVPQQTKSLRKKREREMKREFLDGIQMMAAALQAGYSAENALREALKELGKVYEQDSFIIREFGFMAAQVEMSRSLEALFLDFGRRSAIDDIRSFAEVFLTAKRSGGDLLAIIRNTAGCIRQKQETLQEIETCLAGKVMEHNIMSVIPILILAYVRLTSPEFLDPMYGTITGMAVMAICFVAYVFAYFWGKRIIRIEV